MQYRPKDSSGDMQPVISSSEMLTGVDAVMAAVDSRLRLLHGEWWEDESLGFKVPEFLFDGVRMPAGEQMLSGYITAYIAQTPEVMSVTDVQTKTEQRKLYYHCLALTPYGPAEGEVTQSVLLRAISG